MSGPRKNGLSDKSIGAIAYFTPVMPIFFLAIRRYNKRPFVRFHAWQSLLLNVFAITFGYLLLHILPYLRFLGPSAVAGVIAVAGLAAFLIWLWCVVGAANGKRSQLPILGAWADEQAYR